MFGSMTEAVTFPIVYTSSGGNAGHIKVRGGPGPTDLSFVFDIPQRPAPAPTNLQASVTLFFASSPDALRGRLDHDCSGINVTGSGVVSFIIPQSGLKDYAYHVDVVNNPLITLVCNQEEGSNGFLSRMYVIASINIQVRCRPVRTPWTLDP